MQTEHHDVTIIGGGVVGTALLYTLAKYTDIKSLMLIEKEKKVAQINSHHTKNAQTLHFGDIETHYTVKKAEKVKKAADLIAGYLENYKKDGYYKEHKIALGAGEEEVKKIEKHFHEFKKLFPKLKLIRNKEIEKIEPLITKGRNPKQPLAAAISEDGFAIDYSTLSSNFVKDTKKIKNKEIKINLNEKVKSIKKLKNCFLIKTNQQTLKSKILITSAGAHSLGFAHLLGLGKEFSLLTVAGSLFTSKKKVLNGKCYTLQNKKLPFSAIHGDPDVNNQNVTRFGPTAKVIPLLERHNYKTFWEFLKVSIISPNGLISIIKIMSDKVFFKYGITNAIYDLPVIGKWLFTKRIKKIIPSIKNSDIKRANGYGGVRPQIINTKTKNLQMGEAKIIGEKCLFNITPSPGASVCLKTAQDDAKIIVSWLGKKYSFDEKRFLKDHKRN